MSEIKVNKITPRVACGTTQLGDSGDTITIPSGATIQNLGTATGFGGTGVVSWETGSIKTTGFTAVTGTGYFCDTTGGAFTVTLPLSPSAGDVVGVSDYAKTFDTNNLTLGRNGSNIGGIAANGKVSTEGIAVTLVYVDATKGWLVTDSGNQSDAPGPTYITATGGCITTCGNFKMHTFLSPGAFCVSAVGNPAGSTTVDYLVVAGGAGGGVCRAGGGGAGGYRESPGTASGCYAVSPLGAAPAVALPVSATPYAINVGGGGPGSTSSGSAGTTGSVSTFSTITSTGGGGGDSDLPAAGGAGVGGSGGGGANSRPGSAGNTPPTNPPQGNAGGTSLLGTSGGGGGGAGAVGDDMPSPANGGAGGAGDGTEINTIVVPGPGAQIGTPGPSGPLRYFAGGGGGGSQGAPGAGGSGGGGAGTGCSPNSTPGTAGIVNTGGGGGGSGLPAGNGGNGGSGIIIIRYQYQ